MESEVFIRSYDQRISYQRSSQSLFTLRAVCCITTTISRVTALHTLSTTQTKL